MARLVSPLRHRGFTLIELLIVIAIILILIAIALPNFLEAQMRARVVRSKGEIRTLSIAMESYKLDWGYYPSFSFPNYTLVPRVIAGLTWLTSPNAYISSIPHDPFPGDQGPGGHNMQGEPYSYILDGIQYPKTEFLAHPDLNGAGILRTWAIYSVGPDRPMAEVKANSNANPVCNSGNPVFSYSPTNGTKSRGDIIQYGGDPAWMGLQVTQCLFAYSDKFKSYPRVGQVVNGQVYLQRLPTGL
ncbi:MAG: prepilin-type N-terminal cleavage/methylation domain-containing protein [Candidatus Omnitrophica bacterium]|nr:prepilin-type N-terminal cleavage/methylation domain-containing protein [Candidatus Omnitrophota bacterium]